MSVPSEDEITCVVSWGEGGDGGWMFYIVIDSYNHLNHIRNKIMSQE